MPAKAKKRRRLGTSTTAAARLRDELLNVEVFPLWPRSRSWPPTGARTTTPTTLTRRLA